MSLELPPLKGYQLDGLASMEALRCPGSAVIGVGPPGSGKSRMMVELAERELALGGLVVLKVHRQMLLEQMVKVFLAAKHQVSVLAPGYSYDPSCSIQICSTQTLFSRTVRRSKLAFPDATLVINDEAHQQTGMTERALAYGAYTDDGFSQPGYMSNGAWLVGFTGTPLMNQRIYTDLHQIVNYSQLRKEKMHLPIMLYGPDEIDTAGLKTNVSGDYSEKDLDKRVQVIFGSVFDEYNRLNPGRLPSILFAPSVDSSKWFCYQFAKNGVSAAHISADVILMTNGNGTVETWASNSENRDELLRRSQTGEIKIMCNRFVLREAIDMPWIYHGIFATVMGSPTTALQSIGRLQRYWEGYSLKIIQDHGGLYWRHGSPNSDRHWKIGGTNKSYQKERIDGIMKGEDPEGLRCPKCGAWRLSGPVCVNSECRHTHSNSVRVVRSITGRLKKIEGQVYFAEAMQDRAKKLWKSTLFRAGRSGLTVGAAVAMCGDEARRLGITIDWQEMPWAPPSDMSLEWHKLAKDHWKWLGVPFKKKAKG